MRIAEKRKVTKRRSVRSERLSIKALGAQRDSRAALGMHWENTWEQSLGNLYVGCFMLYHIYSIYRQRTKLSGLPVSWLVKEATYWHLYYHVYTRRFYIAKGRGCGYVPVCVQPPWRTRQKRSSRCLWNKRRMYEGNTAESLRLDEKDNGVEKEWRKLYIRAQHPSNRTRKRVPRDYGSPAMIIPPSYSLSMLTSLGFTRAS